eukprot:CAMPEP_0184327240 /NCGR_PEP_ID=MMETSP1049-20130417/142990_1 /TAXON_ID=77928 /ORGANISM="Proteomonas sulcata, Strain CCMP704" /LENGTH=160 /DNA_ID=CAMNT_0026649487 /DNA_START=446 /DNA_END=928 /DNA_ORIENTATION=-
MRNPSAKGLMEMASRRAKDADVRGPGDLRSGGPAGLMGNIFGRVIGQAFSNMAGGLMEDVQKIHTEASEIVREHEEAKRVLGHSIQLSQPMAVGDQRINDDRTIHLSFMAQGSQFQGQVRVSAHGDTGNVYITAVALELPMMTGRFTFRSWHRGHSFKGK